MLEVIVTTFMVCLTLVSVILGNFSLLKPEFIFPITFVFFSLTLYLKKDFFFKQERINKNALILSLIPCIFILISCLPNLIYDGYRSDFYSRIYAVRVYSEDKTLDVGRNVNILGFLVPIHKYPNGFDSFATSLKFLFENTPQLLTLLNIFIIFLTNVIAYSLFMIITKNKKISLISCIIFSFALTSFWALELGYFPHLLGFLLLLSSLLFYFKKLGFLVIISSAGLLVTYPHYFFVLFVFLLISSIKKKEVSSFLKITFFSVLIALPEILPLGLEMLSYAERAKNVLLIKGGILIPNIFTILAFIPFIFSIKYLKQKKEIFYLILALSVIPILTISAFLLNLVLNFTVVKLQQFYVIIKLVYIAVFPLSILSAVSINNFLNKKNLKYIAFGILVFHVVYLTGYAFISKETIPSCLIGWSESIRKEIKPGDTIGIDPQFLELKEPNKGIFYSSFYDIPSNFTEFVVPSINKLFKFNWTTTDESIVIDNTTKKNLVYFELKNETFLKRFC